MCREKKYGSSHASATERRDPLDNSGAGTRSEWADILGQPAAHRLRYALVCQPRIMALQANVRVTIRQITRLSLVDNSPCFQSLAKQASDNSYSVTFAVSSRMT